MLTGLLFVGVGLALLIYGAQVFVDGAANTSRILSISPLIIGIVIVGFATSMPEIIVGAVAAWQGKTVIAIGNALGSNITNIALVFGTSILILPMTVAVNVVKHEYTISLLAIVLAFLLMLDFDLSRWDALILLLGLIIAMSYIIGMARRMPQNEPPEVMQEQNGTGSLGTAIRAIVIGLILLLVGAEVLVRGAVAVAKIFGVSDLVIGLTIVAVGTSLPELVASIVSIIKKQADIALGNIIGSNMFNLLAVLSIPVLINPTSFPKMVLTRDFPVMTFLSLLLGSIIFLFNGRMTRLQGAFLLLCFIAYQYILFRSFN